jgi:hypothetical protein
MDSFGNPFTSHAGRLWQRFRAHLETRPASLFGAIEGSGYEFHLMGPELAGSGEFEVSAGLELTAPVTLPIEVSVKTDGRGSAPAGVGASVDALTGRR